MRPTGPAGPARSRVVTAVCSAALGVGLGVAIWSAASTATDAGSGPTVSSDRSTTAGIVAEPPATPSPDGLPSPASHRSGGAQPDDRDTRAANEAGVEGAPDSVAAPDPGPTGVPPVLDVPVATTTRSAHAVDELVADFPTEVVPISRSSTVLSSSVSTDGRRVQLSLKATDTGSVARVVDYYTAALGALGFVPTESPAAAGHTATSFVRATHHLVVDVSPQADGSTFTVVGVLDGAG